MSRHSSSLACGVLALLGLAFSSTAFGTAFSSTADAQDALGRMAVDDEWEAILKLAPPANVPAAADAPKKEKEKEKERASTREREASATKERRTSSAGERADKEATKTRNSGDKVAHSDGKRAAREDGESKDGASRGAKKSEKIVLGTEVITTSRPAKSAARADEQSKMESARTRDAAGKSAEEKGGGEGTYEGLVRFWHEPWPEHAGDQAVDILAGAPPVLSLHPVGKPTTPFILLPNGKEGGFNQAQLAVAEQAFDTYPGGPHVSPRLLDVIYRAAQHFKVFHVHLISGIRNDRSGSRHSHGLASDIVLPGINNEVLAAYFRKQGFLGVGIYTRAGFVHVDIREKSFFWLDKSPPGRRTKVIPILAEEARLADEAALQRGQQGNLNPTRLQKALIARAKRRREKATASQ
jgi:hypothetical protein